MNRIGPTALSLAFALALTGPVAGGGRELNQTELRSAVASGQALSFRGVIEGVARLTKGQPVDARAFRADGVYYRVLVKQADGRIISVVVDAATGAILSRSSDKSREVSALADGATLSQKVESSDPANTPDPAAPGAKSRG